MVLYILIYLLITIIVVSKIHIQYRKVELSIGVTVMSLLFPIGGMILVALILKNTNTCYEAIELSYFRDDENQDYKPLFISDIDVNEETDIVALDEVLLLSDLDVRRKTVLNILKRDGEKYTQFINEAIQNQDSETVHYAAASIMNRKRKLDMDMLETSKLYKENPMDANLAISYSKILETQLNTLYIHEEARNMMIKENISVLENIVINRLSKGQEHIIRLIELLLEERQFNLAIDYLNIFMDEYKDTEEKYMVSLKAYYEIEDRKGFEKVLSRIREGGITLSKEAYDIIRFW